MRNTSEIINSILKKRGITDEEDLAEFLTPNPRRTYDPFLLDGMSEGVDLLLREIDKGTRVCIYGDYDADGVTSTSIMCYGIGKLTDNYFYYIPSRFDEGYGLNVKALDKISDKGAGLVITVDCGCVSFDEVEYAKTIGLKIIVTDHHSIKDKAVDCILIDPKKPVEFMRELSEPYPCPHLAGCGVAFKFLQAIQRRAKLPKQILKDVLDLVAIGTIGDIVSLTDENRTLVKYGIAAANSGKRISLTSLSKAISLDGLNSENIAFGIVPHINAAGRIEHASEAAELFITEDQELINDKISNLIEYNKRRKQLQESSYEKCLEHIEGTENFILLRENEIHEGIAGIVAGKIKDKFKRPVIITTPAGDGLLKGTGRSIPGVDLFHLLNNCGNIFERFGGHKGACGFLMKEENTDLLRTSVSDDMKRLLENNRELFNLVLNAEMEILPEEITVDFARELLKLEPFGEGNPNPVFEMTNVLIDNTFYMGEMKTHVRFDVFSAENSEDIDYTGRVSRHRLKCVLFRRAQEFKDQIEAGNPVNLIGRISYQVWKGSERVQFTVEDIINANQ